MNIGWHNSDTTNRYLSGNNNVTPTREEIASGRRIQAPPRPTRPAQNTANRTNATPRNLSSAFANAHSDVDKATDILEHLKENLEGLKLNENKYIKFSNTIMDMHNNNTLSPNNLTNELKYLVEHCPTKAKQKFLNECNEILNPKT